MNRLSVNLDKEVEMKDMFIYVKSTSNSTGAIYILRPKLIYGVVI